VNREVHGGRPRPTGAVVPRKKKVALGQVFSKYFGFPCQLLHSHPQLSSGAGIIGQKWPQYKGLSPTPLAIKKMNIHMEEIRSLIS
jgi:hypothetical protein